MDNKILTIGLVVSIAFNIFNFIQVDEVRNNKVYGDEVTTYNRTTGEWSTVSDAIQRQDSINKKIYDWSDKTAVQIDYIMFNLKLRGIIPSE